MAACLVAALVSFVQAVKPSPCPEQFQYEGGEQGQQWEGTLKLATDDELQGLWIRVKFDTTVKEIVLPVSIFFQRSGSFHSKKKGPSHKGMFVVCFVSESLSKLCWHVFFLYCFSEMSVYNLMNGKNEKGLTYKWAR